MIATTERERIPLAPVQKRVDNHVDVTLAFQQVERDNTAELQLLHSAQRVDTINDIRRRFLARDVYGALTVMESYCDEDGARAAFENLNACIRAYMTFELRDERDEDEDRRALTSAVARDVKVARSGRAFARRITPDCTGEMPQPAA
jgi:hypothetical protein